MFDHAVAVLHDGADQRVWVPLRWLGKCWGRFCGGLVGGAAIAALSTGFMATTALAQEVTLKLRQFLPAQANVPKLILDVWPDNIERDSGGRIKIDRYPSMQLKRFAFNLRHIQQPEDSSSILAG